MTKLNVVENESLIKKAQSGCRIAFQQLLEPLQLPVLRFLRRFLADSDACDVAQETFVLVVKKIDQFEFRSSLKSWVFRIAYRQMINLKNSNSKRPNQPLESVEIGVRDELIDDRSAQVLELIDNLPSHQSEVVWLRIREGLTYREIAEISDSSLNTILSRMHQAKQKLAGQLKKIGIHIGSAEWGATK